jgi:hypothetical protein
MKIKIVDLQDIIDISICMVERHVRVSEHILLHVNIKISLPIREQN